MGGSMCRPDYDSEYECRYWCHYCRQFVLPLFLTDDEITCSRCHNGFVEQFRRRTPFVFLAFTKPRNEIQRNGYGNVPAYTSAVQGLSTVTVSRKHLPSKCTVCLDDFQAGELTCQMPCQHIYHSNCILQWLELHRCCPICRFEMPLRHQVEQKSQRDESTLDPNGNRCLPISVSRALRRVFGSFGPCFGTSAQQAPS